MAITAQKRYPAHRKNVGGATRSRLQREKTLFLSQLNVIEPPPSCTEIILQTHMYRKK